MSRMDIELLNIVRRIRKRLHTVRIMNYILIGIIAALALGVAVVIISRYLPIYAPYSKVLLVLAAGVFAAAVYGLFRRPTRFQAALKADSLGLEERTITAVELIGQKNVFAELEKRDALDKLRKFNYKKQIPMKLNKRYIIACLILVMILGLAGFIPNPMKDRANELHKQKQKIVEQQKKVDDIVKQIKADPKLTQMQKEELQNKLNELKKDLKASKSDKDIEKALMKTEKKLEMLKQDSDSKASELSKVMNALAQNPMTKALADSLMDKDKNELKQELKKLADSLKNMKKEDIKSLAENMEKLAEQLKANPELSKALSNLSSKLAGGELGNISDELAQLGEQLNELMSDEDLSKALSDIHEQLKSMQPGEQQNQNQGSQTQNGQGQTSQGQGNQGDNGHQGSGSQGSGSQSGQGSQGQGGQQGTGQSNGQGGGAGSGTDMGTENTTPIQPGSSGIGKKNGSTKKTGEYERIFTSKTLGGDGEQSNISGTKGNQGTTEEMTTDQSQTIRGDSVPYDQVIGQYTESAYESMNNSDIPAGMKDIVRDYFSSLEE